MPIKDLHIGSTCKISLYDNHMEQPIQSVQQAIFIESDKSNHLLCFAMDVESQNKDITTCVWLPW